MAGLTANSVSQTMTSGDTSADNSVSGYIRNERITLATSPTGTTYQWSLTRPTGSSTAELTDDAAAGPSFVPDSAGTYVVTCIVDGTTSYTLTISCVAVSVSTPVESLRFPPFLDAQIPTPTLGVCAYYSSDQGTLCTKSSNGVVAPIGIGSPTTITFTASTTEPANTAGMLYFYNGEFCIGTGVDEVRGQPMYEQWAPQCRNNTGSIIANGTACYISGALGNKTTVGLPTNANDTSQKTIGLATHDIPINSSTGHITTHGLVRGINTNAWAEGTQLYLGATAGSLTSTKPSGTARVVEVGIVTTQDATDGAICVCVRQLRPVPLPMGIYEARPLASSASYQNLYVWSWTDLWVQPTQGTTPQMDLTNEAYRDTACIKSFVRHDQDNTLSQEYQMPHEWAQTAVLFHAHLIPMAAGSGDVLLPVRYFFGGAGTTVPAYSGWGTIPNTVPLVSGDQYKRKIVALGTIPAPASPLHSDMLSIVLTRNGLSSSDTYTTSKDHGTAQANLCIESLDVHYQRLLTGSEAEFTGNPSTNPSRIFFDKSWIAGTPEVFILARSTNGNPVSFQLYDVTGSVAVGSSMTTSSTSYVMLGTGSLAALGTGTRELRIQGKYDSGADIPVLGAASIFVR